MRLKKLTAVALTATLTIGSLFTGTTVKAQTNSNQVATYAEDSQTTYPWYKTAQATTGDYIADSYEGVERGHVFESVTQERLLDILSSKGNYYIVFAGPEHKTSKATIAKINEIAKKDGITKIYHFDPYVDGYQLDITDEDTEFKGSRGTSINELWKRITELLPNENVINEYNGDDTLLFNYENTDAGNKINAYYELEDANDYNEAQATQDIEKVFRKGQENGQVAKASVRTDYEFFSRVYNGSATYINYNKGVANANRTSKAVEIFTEKDKDNFPLHQVNFNELIDLLNSNGDYVIFFGASWCHNTQAIIGSIAQKAKQAGKKVYVYDTTIGNQLTFGTGNDINIVTAGSSVFNSRSSVNPATGNNNISYVYGELVKYLGNFTTENNSNKNNSISYYPNGDVTAEATSAKPWEDGSNKSAIRLQMPFLIRYNRNAANPVTKNWLHKNKANDGTYTEYMLELTWVLGTKEAKEATDRTGNAKPKDGLSYVDFASEAVQALNTFFGIKETTNIKQPTTTNKPSQEQKVPAVTVKVPAKVTAKALKKSAKITWKKVAGATGYEVYRANKKKGKYKKVKTLKAKATSFTNKKLKAKKTYFFKVRAYITKNGKKTYSSWSAVKKVRVKK